MASIDIYELFEKKLRKENSFKFLKLFIYRIIYIFRQEVDESLYECLCKTYFGTYIIVLNENEIKKWIPKFNERIHVGTYMK